MTMPSVKIKNKENLFFGLFFTPFKEKREFIAKYFISAKIKKNKNERSNFHNELQESNLLLTF